MVFLTILYIEKLLFSR